MNTVEPIRKKSDLTKIKLLLKEQSQRNLLLFLLGINTGLRISDILSLRVADVLNKDYICIVEKKTKKYRKIILSNSLKLKLKNYTQKKPLTDYLFKSRKGTNQPITRIQAYRIIQNACQVVEIKENFGTHTLRKTFGYHFYKKTKDIALLQNILNHSSPKITLRYIGLTQDLIDKSLLNFSL